MLELTFEFPDAVSPKEHNLSVDTRKLGVAFNSVPLLDPVMLPACLEHPTVHSQRNDENDREK